VLTISILLAMSICGDSTPEFEVRCIDGKARSGAVASLAADGSLALDGDKSIVAGEWYSLRRTDKPLPSWPRGPHAELTNGDRVVGSVVAADGDAIVFAPAGAADQKLRFPLSALRDVWNSRPDDREPAWLSAPRRRDVILSRNGDLASGALTAIDRASNRIRFQVEGKDQELDLSKVAAIGFNTDLARVRRLKGPYYRLTLADGTRLSASTLALDGKLWKATTLFNDNLSMPADQIVSIDVEQGKAVSLSQLKPTTFQHQSMDGETVAWAANRCVSGAALRLKTALGESTFDRGIGLHSVSTIVYSLVGKYRRFEAIAGLDARTGTRGDAVLAVFVDGKERELPRGGKLVFSEGPLALQLDVTGAKELTIVVRPGRGGTVQDHVNLADALLIP
jgi:NPCBM/NEW2 domain